MTLLFGVNTFRHVSLPERTREREGEGEREQIGGKTLAALHARLTSGRFSDRTLRTRVVKQPDMFFFFFLSHTDVARQNLQPDLRRGNVECEQNKPSPTHLRSNLSSSLSRLPADRPKGGVPPPGSAEGELH